MLVPSAFASWVTRSHCSCVRRSEMWITSPFALMRRSFCSASAPSVEGRHSSVKSVKPPLFFAMLFSYLLGNPLPEFRNFLCRFTFRFKFCDRAAGNDGAGEGAAVSDVHRGYGEAVRSQKLFGLVPLRGARLAGIENKRARFLCRLGDLRAIGDRGEVERGRPAGD